MSVIDCQKIVAVIRSRIQKLAVAMLVLSRAVWEHSRQLRWLTLRSEDACTLQLAPELKGVVLEASLTTLFYQRPCVTADP